MKNKKIKDYIRQRNEKYFTGMIFIILMMFAFFETGQIKVIPLVVNTLFLLILMAERRGLNKSFDEFSK